MWRRAPIMLTLMVLLAWATAGCSTGESTADMESTIVARVVATLESAAIEAAPTQVPTVPVATCVPPAPTATPMPPEPTSTPEPTATSTPSGPTVTPPPSIEAEEYAVYAAMIEQNPIGYDMGTNLVIRNQTDDLDESSFEKTLEAHPLPVDLADSYRSRNAVSYTLDPSLDLEQSYTLMSQKEHDELFGKRGPGWPEFESRYPEAEGIINFSRVGFSEEGDLALVLMGFRCWDLCGAGGLYLLAKEDGSWVVQKELMAWMS